MSWIGTPYIYGGSSFYGLDCSGLVIEALKSVGELPAHYDGTAKHLYDYFVSHGEPRKSPEFGCLAFFGSSNMLVSHVAICLDSQRMIEAGGGNSQTKNRDDAKTASAFVRIRPISNRRDMISLIMPQYARLQTSA